MYDIQTQEGRDQMACVTSKKLVQYFHHYLGNRDKIVDFLQEAFTQWVPDNAEEVQQVFEKIAWPEGCPRATYGEVFEDL